MEPIISVRNLSVVYGNNPILQDINFDVYRGEVFVIVGGSGCGKTTLLRQLVGLEQPTTGQIFIEGEELTTAVGTRREQLLRRFGVLFQSGGLLASMTVAENIELLLRTYTRLSDERIEQIIRFKLDLVHLAGSENLYPSELSGGMRKRAGIARALALDPPILCFDEPSSGLDPLSAASLDQLILNLNRRIGTTMVVVTHDLASIRTIADRIIMLDKNAKTIVASGTIEELLNYRDNEIVYNFFNRVAI
jgi:phospholipid/cholesterol/gamma-HCH transport system ATP-binding protein